MLEELKVLHDNYVKEQELEGVPSPVLEPDGGTVRFPAWSDEEYSWQGATFRYLPGTKPPFRVQLDDGRNRRFNALVSAFAWFVTSTDVYQETESTE